MATTKRQWLEEGLTLLAEAGALSLIIEALTNRLGVSKGSFYTSGALTSNDSPIWPS